MFKKKIAFSLMLFIILLSFINIVSAESKYTREKSEELTNLIEWKDYTSKTFEKAIDEQKPIFLVISAPAWCYWCHVYESTDYLYNKNLYPFINENFIPILVDSDKRPDLTRKYLEGGWPSTTIFSPDTQRITGFSGPRDPNALRNYLEQLTNYLKTKQFNSSSLQLHYKPFIPRIPDSNQLSQIETSILQYIDRVFDPVYGGFAPAPIQEWREGQKFPKPLILKYLLEQYEITNNKKYLSMVQKTFENQYTNSSQLKTRYRLYDPVQGGFHRYSTKRDWSVPHYEKMLPDQAKMIIAYAQLLKITNNSKVKKALDGTIFFVTTYLMDENGGFYSSQDAYLEEEYFSANKAQREKIGHPYIEKTKTIDSNSMIISAFFYLYELYDNQDYKLIAQKNLDFLQNNLIGDEGAYYYFDYEKEKPFLTGQSISNSWALLAFLNGYKYLEEEKYLKTAKKIADYSLNNLYDWNAGGFFERNSKESDFYAQNEQIDLSKSYEENAVFSYGVLQLYLFTGKLEYLESGLKTLGYLMNQNGGLDNVYYVMKASQLVKENNLLETYENNKNEIKILIDKGQKDFFLDEILKKEKNNVSIDDAPKLKDEFSNLSFFILAILAFTAGMLSFFSPCCLPVLSAYFAHNINSNKGEIMKNTLFFFLGLATILSIFGMGATFIGAIFKENRLLFTKIAGSIIIIFGVLEFFGKGFSGLKIGLKKSSKTPIGSYIFGVVFAIGWSACIGPILASLLLLSATIGTALEGSSLLFIYALGLGIPLIIISLYFDKIKSKKFWKILKGKTINFKVFGKKMSFHSTYLLSGILLILIGILIFNDYLFKLNQVALQSSYVQETIIKGETFLKNLFIR